jgi:hypothetical protein
MAAKVTEGLTARFKSLVGVANTLAALEPEREGKRVRYIVELAERQCQGYQALTVPLLDHSRAGAELA